MIINADDIYQYRDQNGALVFTNRPNKKAQKVILPPISVYSVPMSKSDYQAKGYTNKKDVVTNENHKYITKIINNEDLYYGSMNREYERKQILAEELNKEGQAMVEAKEILRLTQEEKLSKNKQNPEQYQTKLQTIKDAIIEHEKNITYLSKQLGI